MHYGTRFGRCSSPLVETVSGVLVEQEAAVSGLVARVESQKKPIVHTRMWKNYHYEIDGVIILYSNA
eukprot:COSAG02_NODE_3473_length_6684_cov_6.930752_3_plen_67_part_00